MVSGGTEIQFFVSIRRSLSGLLNLLVLKETWRFAVKGNELLPRKLAFQIIMIIIVSGQSIVCDHF